MILWEMKMTPQEIFEYKNRWKNDSPHCVQVDVDSHIWGKDWCRKNLHLDRIDWSFEKYTQPDDSHTFFFKDEDVANKFLVDYKKYNPRFPSEVK